MFSKTIKDEEWLQMKKRINCVLLCFALVISGLTFPYKNISAQATKEMANLVLFISFADTEETYWEGTGGEINRIYNKTERYNALSVKDYFELVSCGKMSLQNLMPQMTVGESDADTVIVPLKLPNNLEWYGGISDDYQLLKDTVQTLNESTELLGKITDELDLTGDGYIDNVSFIVASPETGKTSSLYPHKAEGAQYGLKIKDKPLGAYNIINYGRVSSAAGGAGVVAHEFFHVLGPLDTYTNCGVNCELEPVGCWDVMASTSAFLQYPLSYVRKELGWIDIAEKTVSGTYTLTSPKVDSNNYAMILKTPYSDTEFFVIEYRKKGSFYSEENGDKIDAKIGGSGIIIYRVNTAANPKSNLTEDYIYLFRPGEDEKQNTSLGARNGYFSEEAGRTAFGSSDCMLATADSAITYTDGTNSGIVIKNIGSAAGDKISFDLEYTIDMQGEYWEKENNPSYASNAKTVAYNGKLYSVQNNSEGKTELICYTGGEWKSLRVLTEGYYGDAGITAGSDGLLYVVCEQEYKELKIFCMDAKEDIREITGDLSVEGSVANPKIIGTSRGPVIAYRDYLSADTLHVYAKGKTDWEKVDTAGANGNAFSLYGNGKSIYLATGHGKENQVYHSSFSEDSSHYSGFEKLGDSFCENVATCVDLAMDKYGVLYVVYYDTDMNLLKVKGYRENKWEQLGMNVYHQLTLDIKSYIEGETVYVTYQDEMGNILTKRHKIFENSGVVVTPENPTTPPAVEFPDKDVDLPKPTIEPGADHTIGTGESDFVPSQSSIGKTYTDKKTKAVYRITSEKTAEYQKCKLKKGKVVIPAEITIGKTSYQVTAVEKRAFSGNKGITSVVIGKNVKKIGKQAFYGCKKLKKITIKTKKLTQKKIGNKAFYKIAKQAKFKVPKGKKKAYAKMLKAKGAPKDIKIS